MASSRALMKSMRALKKRLEDPPARGGGYRSRTQVMVGSDHGVQAGGDAYLDNPCAVPPPLLRREAVPAPPGEGWRWVGDKHTGQWSRVAEPASEGVALARLRREMEAARVGPDGFQARDPDRWVGENEPDKPPPGDDWHWVETVAGLGQWYKGKHADIDTLAVPDERQPSPKAPVRRLLGYLIRQLLRRWVARLSR